MTRRSLVTVGGALLAVGFMAGPGRTEDQLDQQLPAARRKLTVRLQAFGQNGVLDANVAEFTGAVTPRELLETGYSYYLSPQRNPGSFDGSKGPATQGQAVIKDAQESATDANATRQS